MVYAIEADRNKLHIILCEGSFSMDGSCNYLAQLLELSKIAAADFINYR